MDKNNIAEKPLLRRGGLAISASQSWQKILADSYKMPKDLLCDLDLPAVDVTADSLFATRVPKPFAAKMEKGNINDPLLLQVLPQRDEFLSSPDYSDDPLLEKRYNLLPGLLHKYPSRVLLTLQGACAVNCRYCFRRHFDYADNRINHSQLTAILDYITTQPQVNEIVLSGGDPLMSKDSYLAGIIQRFEALPQIKRLRFHTRLPVVIPERITDELVAMLANSRLQTVMVIHCNHPNEIDAHFSHYLGKLRRSQTQLLNQSVLLKKVNDDAQVLATLSERLFAAGILPYYLFLLDKVNGAGHFEVPEARAKALIKAVAARLPGYLVPKLARETPGLDSKNMWV